MGVDLGSGDVGVAERAWTERRSAPLSRSVAKAVAMTWGDFGNSGFDGAIFDDSFY